MSVSAHVLTEQQQIESQTPLCVSIYISPSIKTHIYTCRTRGEFLICPAEYADSAGQCALHNVAVEPAEDLFRHTNCPQPPHEIQPIKHGSYKRPGGSSPYSQWHSYYDIWVLLCHSLEETPVSTSNNALGRWVSPFAMMYLAVLRIKLNGQEKSFRTLVSSLSLPG